MKDLYAAQQYAPQVAQYFDRPLRAMGQELQGTAGTVEQGLWVRFGADVHHEKLVKVGFRAFACPHIIAACNRVVEELEGAPVSALLELVPHDLQAEFDIPVEKAGKLLILNDAVRACYADYRQRSAG